VTDHPGAGIGVNDGTYDVFVIDAEIEGDGASRVAHLDLTIIAGEHKGEVLSVAAAGMAGDEFELIGMPATLVVTDGAPSVTIDS
jgi:hypothetical protein